MRVRVSPPAFCTGCSKERGGSTPLPGIKTGSMPKKEKNKKVESAAIEEMEEKTKKRERKKKREMDVSGKSVFKLKELKEKKEENLSQDEE